jgi:hypothetical protein
MQELCTFFTSAQNCASFDTLWVRIIVRKNIFQLSKGGGTFLEDKRSNQVKTIQHIKSAFLYTRFRLSMGTQNHLKQSDLGKSLDPPSVQLWVHPNSVFLTIVCTLYSVVSSRMALYRLLFT